MQSAEQEDESIKIHEQRQKDLRAREIARFVELLNKNTSYIKDLESNKRSETAEQIAAILYGMINDPHAVHEACRKHKKNGFAVMGNIVQYAQKGAN